MALVLVTGLHTWTVHRNVARRSGRIVCLLLAFSSLGCTRLPRGTPAATSGASQPAAADRHPVAEASGIVKSGNALLLVDDERPGGYFRVSLPRIPLSRIDPQAAKFIHLRNSSLALDLEGIAVLADDRVVVLSERPRALVSDGGLVWEYGEVLSEVGGMGLEGVAVTALADSSSEVAVVWEGGYLRGSTVPPPLRQALDTIIADPVVFIHRIRAHAKWDALVRDSTATVTLHLPRLDHPTRATTFRVPDIVWHTPQHGQRQLIALLNSFDRAQLLRFDPATGVPIGEPLDLRSVTSIPDSVQRLKPNWEGLGWFDVGRSLVIVDDKGQHRGDTLSPYIAIVPLPPEWR